MWPALFSVLLHSCRPTSTLIELFLLRHLNTVHCGGVASFEVYCQAYFGSRRNQFIYSLTYSEMYLCLFMFMLMYWMYQWNNKNAKQHSFAEITCFLSTDIYSESLMSVSHSSNTLVNWVAKHTCVTRWHTVTVSLKKTNNFFHQPSRLFFIEDLYVAELIFSENVFYGLWIELSETLI